MSVFQFAARVGVKLFCHSRVAIGCAVVILTVGLFGAQPAEAVVVISDGFGDADRDNRDGALQLSDTDINLNETIGTYEPTQANMEDTIYPDGTLINEVTAVENAADIGISWYNARGFTSSGQSKPNIKIVDDTVGNFPETNGIGPQAIEAIDDGLALGFEQKGRGSASAGFFGQTIELGPEVGDQVKVSFDFRIWLSAPNFNGSANNHIPEEAELRFGLFEDTDSQLGLTNDVAGFGQTPAVWGQEDGEFRGTAGTVGAIGDHGWFVKAPIENPGGTFVPVADGASARIVEEINDIDAFLGGGDSDTVASPNQADPQFVNLDIHNVYNLALTLERFDDPDTAGTEGDTIKATYTVIERTSGQMWELSDYEEVGVEGTNDLDGGIESDKWDYFGISTRSLDEIDWILDNFMLEIIGSNEPSADPEDLNGDGFVDGLDLGILLGNFNQSGINAAGGELNGADPVDGLDLGILLGAWSPPAADGLAAVPEPSSMLLLALGLGGMVSRRLRR